MAAAPFDLASVVRKDLPPPAVKYAGFATYNFIGGHNDPASTPIEGLIEATATVLRREGRTLATYGMASGPMGYIGLREFLVKKLKAHAGITCTTDEVLITSGSGQGLALVHDLLASPGDTVLIEQDCYGGVITRLNKAGARIVGVPLDRDGMRMDALASTLDGLKAKGIRPRYIYTIPTIQNPTASIMPEARRHEMIRLAMAHNVPIFEDECYSDLVFDGRRPPAIKALSPWPGIIHIGSFSKSIAPALRLGYVVAGWDILSRLLPLKSDSGTGALEQMVLAEYCTKHFDTHVKQLNGVLASKLKVLTDLLAEHFGTAAEFEPPKGGIFLWIKLPDQVDTSRLFQVAAKAGIALNPGAEWSADSERGKKRLRLCFANPSPETIRAGVAALAEVCHREMGVPTRIANVTRR